MQGMNAIFFGAEYLFINGEAVIALNPGRFTSLSIMHFACRLNPPSENGGYSKEMSKVGLDIIVKSSFDNLNKVKSKVTYCVN